MRKNAPNEPNTEDILNLLCSLDSGLLKAVQAQGSPIIAVTAIPVSAFEDDDEDDCDEDYDEDELEDDEDDDCPDYEPSGDGTGRCVYSCPECGICLREYIGEEFE